MSDTDPRAQGPPSDGDGGTDWSAVIVVGCAVAMLVVVTALLLLRTVGR